MNVFFLILQYKIEVVAQQNEFLWKSIFGLSTKGVDIEKETNTVAIEDDNSSGESSSVLSLQGSILQVHAITPDTPEAK